MHFPAPNGRSSNGPYSLYGICYRRHRSHVRAKSNQPSSSLGDANFHCDKIPHVICGRRKPARAESPQWIRRRLRPSDRPNRRWRPFVSPPHAEFPYAFWSVILSFDVIRPNMRLISAQGQRGRAPYSIDCLLAIADEYGYAEAVRRMTLAPSSCEKAYCVGYDVMQTRRAM